MTNKFKEGRESKNKKLLVPVLALFLCATALIGVGYAAVVSSVSVTGNDIGVSHVYIDFEANTEGTFSSSADTIDAGSRIIDGVTYYDLNETGTYVIGKAILKLDAAVYTTMQLNYNVETSELTGFAIPEFKLFYKEESADIGTAVEIVKGNSVTLNVDDLNGKELILKAVYADSDTGTSGIQVLDPPKGFTYTIKVTCTPVA